MADNETSADQSSIDAGVEIENIASIKKEFKIKTEEECLKVLQIKGSKNTSRIICISIA